MKHLTTTAGNLAFSCTQEKIPAASNETEMLFQYARWLQKNNLLKQDEKVNAEVERLYRIASENSHYKAMINLQNGAMRGRFKLRNEEQLRMSQQLIDAGVASGYYFVGIFLQHGSAGLKKDHEKALQYYRKAADEGSALAQVLVADKLAPIKIAPNVARQMRRCAAEQGNGEAARALAIDLSIDGHLSEATAAFQLGVAAGDETSAGFLDDGFRGPEPTDELNYLGQSEDLERADRYNKIWKLLSGYSYANPKVPEINEIVPLPPAPLPAWDGKLKWLEERLANIPPEKPSEALIHQLAKARMLDPLTGRPMPGSPDFVKIDPDERPACNTGEPCTHTGYWHAYRVAGGGSYVGENKPQRFEKGRTMPTLAVSYRQRRFLLPDVLTSKEEKIEWRLVGEA